MEGLVVCEELHIIGGELVRGREVEGHDAVLVGAQEGLPGDGVREILTDGGVLALLPAFVVRHPGIFHVGGLIDGLFDHHVHRGRRIRPHGALGQHPAAAGLGEDPVGRSAVGGVPAFRGGITDARQAPLPGADGLPDIGLDGLRALVEDGGGDLRSRGGTQGEAIVRVRGGGVQEAAETERQLIDLRGLVGGHLVGEGAAVPEPEDLEGQGFGIAGLAREAYRLEGSGLGAFARQADDALLQQAVAVAVELGHDPGGPGGGADLQGDAVPVIGNLLEETPHVHVEHGVGVGGLDHVERLFLRVGLARLAHGLGHGFDGVEPGRQAGEGQVEGLAVGDLSFLQGADPAQDLVADLEPGVGPGISVAGLEAGPDEVVADDGPAAPLRDAFEAAFGLVEHIQVERDAVRDGDRMAELKGLAGAVRDGHGDDAAAVPALVGGLELDAEVPAVLQLQRALGDALAAGIDLVAGRGRAQAVAGVAADGALHGHLVLGEIEARVFLPAQLEAGQHEFIRPHPGGGDLLAVLVNGNLVHAAPFAFLEDEGTGGGAEFVRGQVGLPDQLVGRVSELGVQADAFRAGGVGVGAFVEQDLEVDGLVGVEGAAVGQQDGVVPGRVVGADGLPGRLDDGMAPGHPQAAPVADDRPHPEAVMLFLEVLYEALRQVGETVEREILHPVHLFSFLVLEQEVAAADGLSGQVVRHIHAVAVQVALVGDGEGVFIVLALVRFPALGALDDVGAVVDVGQPENQGIRDVETFLRIGDHTVEDLRLVLEDADPHLGEVAQPEGEGAALHVGVDVLVVELAVDVVDLVGAFGDGLLLAGEAFLVREEALAVAVQGLELVRAAVLVPAQLPPAVHQHPFAGKHRDGPAFVLAGEGLEMGDRLLGTVFPVDPGIFDEGVEGVAARVVRGDGFPDLVGAPAAEEAPERVFVVVADAGDEGVGVVEAQHVGIPGVEFGIVRLLQLRFLLPDIGEKLGGFAVVPSVIENGDGFAELLQVGDGFRVELVVEFPVGAGPGIDIFPVGIVEVPREVLLGSFLLDAQQDVGLVLGLVGIDGLVVLGPERDQGMVLAVLGAGGQNHRTEGQEGYQCVCFHNVCC